MPAVVCECAYLGLGSNLDDPEQQVRRAVNLLREIIGLRLLDESALYRTAPWGNPDQPNFVNAVIAVDCELSPLQLLREASAIERRMGRVRDTSRWTPRIIDIDLLYYGRRMFSAPGLTVPHAQAGARGFVLVPLIEVGGRLADPRVEAWQHQLSNLPHDDVIRLHPKNSSRPTLLV